MKLLIHVGNLSQNILYWTCDTKLRQKPVQVQTTIPQSKVNILKTGKGFKQVKQVELRRIFRKDYNQPMNGSCKIC